MTHRYAKSIRKKLRDLAGLAHELELSRVQEDDLLVCRAVKLGFLSRYEIANFIGCTGSVLGDALYIYSFRVVFTVPSFYNFGMQRDAHDFMRFLFYFWSFAKIADIYFVWFYELLEIRDPLILPAGFLTSWDKGY
jgi:hypothetical protein